MLNAALDGKLDDVGYKEDPIFKFQVPQFCPGVPNDVLDPASSWPSQEAYMRRYRDLAARFIDNFKKFEGKSPVEVKSAGPVLN
jgi:phosphoenolpyruvate carboxykinase (ATP)